MYTATYLLGLLTSVGLASAAPQSGSVLKRSPEPVQEGGKFIVDRQTQFSHHNYFSFDGDRLPDGLFAANYGIGSTHTYRPQNAILRDGYLELLVEGGQTVMPYTGGQIETTFGNIKHASVRTVAILSDPAGVCNGMFFFKSDTQESDIEWLSDANSKSNMGERLLWFTNQDASGDGKKTNNAVQPPANPTSTEHEYRIDWTEGLVEFYVDGQKLWSTTKDVPTVPGSWLWNNWSNGDIQWSAGPPSQDAVFKIKEIDMYYNTV